MPRHTGWVSTLEDEPFKAPTDPKVTPNDLVQDAVSKASDRRIGTQQYFQALMLLHWYRQSG